MIVCCGLRACASDGRTNSDGIYSHLGAHAARVLDSREGLFIEAPHAGRVRRRFIRREE